MGQRGQTLIEAAFGAAILTLLLGGALTVALAASAHLGQDPVHVALDAALHAEMATARDLLKYQGTALQPVTIATTLPMPDGSPLPATLQLQATAQAGGDVAITISASATARGATQSLSLTSTVLAQAPLPGVSLTLPGLVPAPTGAP